MKQKIKFLNEFTLGTLFQIATMIFMAGGFWYTTKLQIDSFKSQQSIMDSKLDRVVEVQSTMLQTEARLSALLEERRGRQVRTP